MRYRKIAAAGALLALGLASCADAGVGSIFSRADVSSTGSGTVTCADAIFDRDSARPTNIVRIAALPTGFDDDPALRMAGPEAYDDLTLPVARHPEAGSYFVVPVLPSNPVKGGPVELQLIDSAGEECDPVNFEIAELPSAPGAFRAYAEELENLNEATSDVFGIEIEDTSQPSGAPVLQPFETASDWLSGTDNPNSIEKVLDGTADVSSDLNEEAEQLMDGLIEESGVIEHIQETIADVTELTDPPVWTEDPPSEDPPGEEPPTAADDPPTPEAPSAIGEKICERIGGDMSAQALSQLMQVQGGLEKFRADTDLILDGVGLLNGVIGVGSLALTGGVPNPVTAATGVIGVSLSTYDLLSDASIHMLPAEFSGLDFDYEKALYLEDEEDLGGYWENVHATARGKDWNMDGRILEQVIGRATGGISKRFLTRHGADTAAHAAGEFLTETFSSGTAAALSAHQSGSGLITIPACSFGPVDLSDPEFHQAEFFLPSRPAAITDDRQFEIFTTGKARLVVRARAEKFGGATIMKAQPVEAAPIEITIDPPVADGDPGFTAVFTVTVENAHDPSVDISLEPTGGHQLSVEQIGSNVHEVTVVTSSQREDFPALLRVESTANTGLRAEPDAPPRVKTARIASDGGISLSPRSVCLEPGEKLQFEAEIYEFDNKDIVWDATGGIISANGSFTAPDSTGKVDVRAAAAADRTHSAVSKVTVAEHCQCWASFELPMRGIHEVGSAGHIRFGDGERAEQLQRITFDLENGGEVITEFFNVLHSDIDIAPDWPDRGPKSGQGGRYLVDMREGGFEPTGQMVDFRSNLYFARPLGGVRYSTEIGQGEMVQTSWHTHATVTEFNRDGDTYWLEGRVTGEVMVEDGIDLWRLEPVRMEFQGEFTRNTKAEELFPGITGTHFEPWSCNML
ncbi:MAG TPA: hypothetical protein VK096_06270 [Actinomycetales bacterium]|nr:hypothetical protein [Actinomycetales bacterium]